MAGEGHSRQKAWHGQRSGGRKANGQQECAGNEGEWPAVAEGAVVLGGWVGWSLCPHSLPPIPHPRNHTTRFKWSSSWQSMATSTRL